jgi:hypothetical protein
VGCWSEKGFPKIYWMEKKSINGRALGTGHGYNDGCARAIGIYKEKKRRNRGRMRELELHGIGFTLLLRITGDFP